MQLCSHSYDGAGVTEKINLQTTDDKILRATEKNSHFPVFCWSNFLSAADKFYFLLFSRYSFLQFGSVFFLLFSRFHSVCFYFYYDLEIIFSITLLYIPHIL